MYIIQNCNNQARRSQYNHEFFISRHEHLPFPQDSERVAAALPAALVSILYCQGGPPRVGRGIVISILRQKHHIQPVRQKILRKSADRSDPGGKTLKNQDSLRFFGSLFIPVSSAAIYCISGLASGKSSCLLQVHLLYYNCPGTGSASFLLITIFSFFPHYFVFINQV